ncbi:penicillin-binding protein 2 [Pandoraea sputorum]|uniref:penicillin-binding protein 2 n=1 Tax=Pandoraea sputorum TaxID=93222 RepID=UPI001241CD24|nr:penicillin-binding protein 2 [Pandoraea sputorum]VVE80712.1 Peptidoglycan D,D-transpeptidase MrdA [Pandoraea sputorum]
MTEFKNPQQQLQTFHLRVTAAAFFVLICFSLLAVRFVYLQVFRHNQYALQADENRVSLAPIVPNRGVIMDRNGVVLARNYSAYTLEITPSKIGRPLEDLVTDLSDVIEITPRDRARFKKLMDDSKSFESLPIRTRLTDEEVARFTAQRFRFPGVDVHARLFRQYPLGETAAHVIGYIGRISQRDRQRIDAMSEENDSDSAKYDIRRDVNNYKGTDYIGKIGVEQSYETQLHGITGFEEIEVTAGGRPVRTISRTPATPGDNLVLSIDIKLQQVAEQAFAGRRGAVVAIEPKTGDVLAFVSAPSFDPNLFVEGIDQQNWDALNTSADRPLLNRPLRGTYPIGSTYKPFMALAALELGKRTTSWGFQDTGSFTLGNHTFRNDVRNGQGWIDMYRSIVVSNDTYYYMLAHDLGVNAIHDFMAPLGFGQLTGIDIEGEARGILPSTEWKRKAYKKPAQQKWYDGETISLGIGQGYNSFTILQLAHATATLANNGVVMKPHLVKAVEDPVSHARQLTVPHESARLPYKQADIDFVKRAMVGVIKEGTGRQAFAGAPYDAGGKTGTAQVYSLGKNEKYNHNAIPEFKRDHALFIAFAPAEDPKIAIALIVENAGWGGAQAGPVARRLLDYYLIDEPKERAAEAAALQAAASGAGAASAVSATPDAPPASAAELDRTAGAATTTVSRVAPGASGATATNTAPRVAGGKASAPAAAPATPQTPPPPQQKPAVSPTVADEARHRAAIRAQRGQGATP